MKEIKFIIVLSCIIGILYLSVSQYRVQVADDTYKYTLKYVIFYPGYRDTIELVNDKGYFWASDRGTNYINESSITGPKVYCNSAPYKILSYTKKRYYE